MSPAAGQSSGELVDFVDSLRLNGYGVGTEQYVTAQRLLVTLAAQDDYVTRPESLESMLAPVLCSTPEEQQAFPSLYAQWLATRPRIFELRGEASPESAPKPQPKPRPRPSDIPKSRLKWWNLLAALGLAATVVGLFLVVRRPTVKQYTMTISLDDDAPEDGVPVHVKVTTGGGTSSRMLVDDRELTRAIIIYCKYTSQDLPLVVTIERRPELPHVLFISEPTSGISIESNIDSHQFATTYTTPITPSLGQRLWDYLKTYTALFVGAMAGLAVALVLLRWLLRRARRMSLKKWRAENKPRLDRLRVRGASEFLARALPLRRTAQELRRYREYDAYDIDVHRTIEATIRHGLFTPAYSARKSLPEYLVLIDRAGFDDHQARLADEIVAQLDLNDVYVDRLYFKGDPRVCRPDDPKAPNHTLPELAAQYPTHNLLIFGDAEGFFSPVTGRPRPWLDVFSQWETRVLLTSEMQQDDYRSWVLGGMGFKVLPANRAGLAALGETLHDGLRQGQHAAGAGGALPPDLGGRQTRWLESQPPAQPAVEELCLQLRQTLGEEGYEWLSACAVYPVLNWDLTVYLGHELFRKGDFAATLSTLVRLTWFRHGSMPDWLRARLIMEMPPEQERRVRDALQKLLLTSLTNPGGFDLFLAREPGRSTTHGLFRRALDKALGRGRDEERFVVGNLEEEDEDSPLRDYVLLSFMEGRKPNALTLNLPDELLKILEPPDSPDREPRYLWVLLHSIFAFVPLLTLVFVASSELTPLIIAAPILLAWLWLVSHSLRQMLGEGEAAAGPLSKALELISESLKPGGRIRAALDDGYGMVRSLVERLKPQPPTTREQQAFGETIMDAPAEVIKQTEGAAPVNVPATDAALRQMPPMPGKFTGREKELETLASMLERRGCAIIWGAGGVGKTALSLAAAEGLASQYPDAQLYLDMGGVDRRAAWAADALAHVIRAYMPAEKLPEVVSELRELYLSALEGKRALILFDDVPGREVIETLLPPEGCALIITSRARITTSDYNSLLLLETLTREAARELLIKLAPHTFRFADIVVEFCENLPLTLRLAAGVLAPVQLDHLDGEVKRLLKSRRRFKSPAAESVLDFCYSALDDSTQKRLRALSVFPNTFYAHAAAAVWETDIGEAQGALVALVGRGFVEFNPKADRYHMHGLVRAFAESRLTDEEQVAPRALHAAHYLGTLETANRLYERGRESVEEGLALEGLALFDLEFENVRAAFMWAESLARLGEKSTAGLFLRYLFEGRVLLGLRQPAREKIAWLETALSAARYVEPRPDVSWCYMDISISYMELGEEKRSIEFMERGLAHARETGDHVIELRFSINLGIAYSNVRELRRALELHGQSLLLARELGLREVEGTLLRFIGATVAGLGEVERAIAYFEQSVEIARELDDRSGEAQTLGNLGQTYYALGDQSRAIELYEQQLRLTREIGDKTGEAAALFNASLALESMGNSEMAISHAEAALHIFELLGSPYAEHVRERLSRLRGSAD